MTLRTARNVFGSGAACAVRGGGATGAAGDRTEKAMGGGAPAFPNRLFLSAATLPLSRRFCRSTTEGTREHECPVNDDECVQSSTLSVSLASFGIICGALPALCRSTFGRGEESMPAFEPRPIDFSGAAGAGDFGVGAAAGAAGVSTEQASRVWCILCQCWRSAWTCESCAFNLSICMAHVTFWNCKRSAPDTAPVGQAGKSTIVCGVVQNLFKTTAPRFA